jgi:hypothetical protein
MAESKRTRRKPTFGERMRPCRCCGFPLTHQHHVLEVALYPHAGSFGDVTIPLCANCHDLYHLYAKTMLPDASRKTKDLWLFFSVKMGTLAGKVKAVWEEASETKREFYRAVIEDAKASGNREEIIELAHLLREETPYCSGRVGLEIKKAADELLRFVGERDELGEWMYRFLTEKEKRKDGAA